MKLADKLSVGDLVEFRKIKGIRPHYQGVQGRVTKISKSHPHTCAMRPKGQGFDTMFHPNDVKMVKPKSEAKGCVVKINVKASALKTALFAGVDKEDKYHVGDGPYPEHHGFWGSLSEAKRLTQKQAEKVAGKQLKHRYVKSVEIIKRGA